MSEHEANDPESTFKYFVTLAQPVGRSPEGGPSGSNLESAIVGLPEEARDDESIERLRTKAAKKAFDRFVDDLDEVRIINFKRLDQLG